MSERPKDQISQWLKKLEAGKLATGAAGFRFYHLSTSSSHWYIFRFIGRCTI